MTAPRTMTARVELVVGDDRWPLETTRRYVVGRGEHADIRIHHPEVSRRHADVVFEPGSGWVVRDAGSLNGVHVDGTRVAEARLSANAHVALGPSPEAPVLKLIGAEAAHDGGDAEVDGGEHRSHTVTVARMDGLAVTIGREPSNSIVVDDLLVSRRHVRATPRDAGFWVEDLGSLNGTYVNGAPISAEFVGPGDLLSVGHHEFRVVGDALVMTEASTRISFVASELSFVLPTGKPLLGDVSFSLPESSLLAVIGPSGAGKSTLLGALTASQPATSGKVAFDGRDLYDNFAELRHRIGVVPQDDVVHRQLTVRQALEYASRLRFPSDLDVSARRTRIEEVVDELGLRAHVDTRVGALSGGQRKRTSVALELLTRPSLLFLDEPTSGLDPGLDKSVMTTLRNLADDGRTVVVITHSVANLGLCDRVLLLAPGGRIAFFGRPEEVLPFFDLDDYSDIFERVAADPAGSASRYTRHAAMTRVVPTGGHEPAAPSAPRRRQSTARQAMTLTRRHLRVLAADRSYSLFTVLLPLVLAGLVAAVPGQAGFGPPIPPEVGESRQLLVVLIVGAAFMGMAASARDLVGERPIFRRERAVGLSAGAYLVAKLMVFGLLTAVQSALLLGLVLLFKDAPDIGVAVGYGALELYAAVALTAFASATLGMVISAAVGSTEQVMPLLVVSIMAQLVLCGGLIPVVGRVGLEQLAWLAPSRWGYAAAASTLDVLGRTPAEHDDLWRHEVGVWAGDLGMLGIIALVCAALTAWRLARVGRRG